MPDDTREAEAMRVMEQTGWGGFIVRRQCHSLPHIQALASLGLVSSSDMEPGATEWVLHLTRLGKTVRAMLKDAGHD